MAQCSESQPCSLTAGAATLLLEANAMSAAEERLTEGKRLRDLGGDTGLHVGFAIVCAFLAFETGCAPGADSLPHHTQRSASLQVRAVQSLARVVLAAHASLRDLQAVVPRGIWVVPNRTRDVRDSRMCTERFATAR